LGSAFPVAQVGQSQYDLLISSSFEDGAKNVKRLPRRPDQSVRNFPTYTIPEAATYLAIPTRTLRYWISDEPVWTISGAAHRVPLLSFRDLAQAYYIEVVRRNFGLSLPKMRGVLKAARKESKSEYPLLRKNILLFFKHVLMEKPARRRQPHRLIDLTQHRQLTIPEVARPFSTRIQWNSIGEPVQIFPWRYWTIGDKSRPVSIHPDVMSGRLVITGTRIPVQTVLRRREAGETLTGIAGDYGLPEDAIKQALRHLVPQAA
jgi:uncharacterized protein (DUF433 family)/DNA-binding transcriptional MerR regulator